METQKCTSCHREQSFCLDCHMRVGVAESSPPNAKDSGRFHPPKSIWSDPPRKPGHHAFEAERNLNACVSCHTERDCVVVPRGARRRRPVRPAPERLRRRLRDPVPQKSAARASSATSRATECSRNASEAAERASTVAVDGTASRKRCRRPRVESSQIARDAKRPCNPRAARDMCPSLAVWQAWCEGGRR